MKNILLVFTGGTIGSLTVETTINPCESARYKLLQLFAEQDNDPLPVAFKTLQPLQILSENLHPEDWTLLITAIEAEDLYSFDGIILTHGTDTLGFSAAALGLYFNDLKIPMLLVSSDLPLDNPLANGLPNFLCAVTFIRRMAIGGVFVPYKTSGSTLQIHMATHLASSPQLSSHFPGLQSKAFMQFEGGEFNLPEIPPATPPTPWRLQANFSPKILLIRPFPGIDYSQFKLEGVSAVLHDLYHSGTACASARRGEQYCLTTFIKHCRQQNLNVYLAPALFTENIYGSTRELLAAGATMIWNISLETAYAKLLLAYGNFESTAEIEFFLQTDIAGEHVF